MPHNPISNFASQKIDCTSPKANSTNSNYIPILTSDLAKRKQQFLNRKNTPDAELNIKIRSDENINNIKPPKSSDYTMTSRNSQKGLMMSGNAKRFPLNSPDQRNEMDIIDVPQAKGIPYSHDFTEKLHPINNNAQLQNGQIPRKSLLVRDNNSLLASQITNMNSIGSSSINNLRLPSSPYETGNFRMNTSNPSPSNVSTPLQKVNLLLSPSNLNNSHYSNQQALKLDDQAFYNQSYKLMTPSRFQEESPSLDKNSKSEFLHGDKYQFGIPSQRSTFYQNTHQQTNQLNLPKISKSDPKLQKAETLINLANMTLRKPINDANNKHYGFNDQIAATNINNNLIKSTPNNNNNSIINVRQSMKMNNILVLNEINDRGNSIKDHLMMPSKDEMIDELGKKEDYYNPPTFNNIDFKLSVDNKAEQSNVRDILGQSMRYFGNPENNQVRQVLNNNITLKNQYNLSNQSNLVIDQNNKNKFPKDVFSANVKNNKFCA